MERLVERVARRLGLAVGPEQREQPVPADAPPAGGGDDGEQGQPAALGGGTGVELAVLMQDQPAEGAQSQHARDGMLRPARRAAR